MICNIKGVPRITQIKTDITLRIHLKRQIEIEQKKIPKGIANNQEMAKISRVTRNPCNNFRVTSTKLILGNISNRGKISESDNQFASVFDVFPRSSFIDFVVSIKVREGSDQGIF